MEFSRINDTTKFPLKTSDDEAGQSPKFIGYDDDENIAMRANELVTRGITDDLANIQSLLGIEERVLREVTHVIPDVDLTQIGFTTLVLPANTLFLAHRVTGYAKTRTNWTVIPSFCAVGLTNQADIPGDAADWGDNFFQVLNRPTSTLDIDESINWKISEGKDSLYVEIQTAGATADALVADFYVAGIEIPV